MSNVIKQIENHSLLNQRTADGKLKQIDIVIRYSSGFLTKVDKFNVIFESNDFVYRLCLDELNEAVLNRILSALELIESDLNGFTEYVEIVDYSFEDVQMEHDNPYYTTY